MSSPEPAREEADLISELVCIYCKGPSGDARAQEHVVPHSLGNEDWKLPRGMVCDVCNNYFGSLVDSKFVDAGAGRLRSLLGVPGKHGPTKWTLPHSVARKFGDHPEGAVVTLQGFPSSRIASNEMGVERPNATIRLRIVRPSPDRESAFLSRLLLASIGAILGSDNALLPELDLHRDNMRCATLNNHLPFEFHKMPGSARALWTLWFCPDGIVFDMWGMVRYGMALDGKAQDVLSSTQTRRGFSFEGVYRVEGGPEVWPVEEWARRLGDAGKKLLEP